MRPATVTFAAGFAALGIGLRALSGVPSTAAQAVGLALLLASIVLRLLALRGAAAAAEERGWALGEQLGLLGTGVALAAVVLWAVGARGMAAVDAPLWRIAAVYGWPLGWAVGAALVFSVDAVIAASGRMVPERRIRERSSHALAIAMTAGIAAAVNGLAHRHDVYVDLAHFRTTSVGAATRALVEGMPGPLTVYVFLPPASDLAPELLGYFGALGERVDVQVHDAAAQPALVERVKVKGNGAVALVLSKEDGGEVVRVINVGETLDKAKSTLRKLDQEVGKSLRELQRGRRKVYLTAGHGELAVTGKNREQDERTKLLRKLCDYLGLDLQGLSGATGLLDGVPEDAAMVLILGPRSAFLPGEAEAIDRYLAAGGRVLAALEPARRDPVDAPGGGDPMLDVLARWGVAREPGLLASDTNVLALTNTELDRTQLLTDRFSSHPTTATLSRVRPPAPVYLPSAAALSQTEVSGERAAVVVIRTLASAWIDVDGDLVHSAGIEKKKPYALAIAVTGEEDARMFVTGDSTWLSDQGLETAPGNRQLLVDVMAWLNGEVTGEGAVENEEDVKISHSREGQAIWFYATVLAVPALFGGMGLLRVRRRARRSA